MWADERALFEKEYQDLAKRRTSSTRSQVARVGRYGEIIEHLYNKKLVFTARSVQEAMKRAIEKRPHISEFFVIDFLEELGIKKRGTNEKP